MWKCTVQDTLDKYINPIDWRVTAEVLLPQNCLFCVFLLLEANEGEDSDFMI